ncbi:MAG TPA: hypothetical protein VGS28_02285 [Candidatus Saccharimonadales bacterium]|nr:hypothetical protein [Candidatus Saccharimonadales bacterium]
MSNLKKRFPLYAQALRLYPRPYRLRYEDEMLRTTADMVDGVKTRRGQVALWLHILADQSVNITKQNIQYTGGEMNQTPPFITRSSLLAGLLLLPFFGALLANALDKVINDHTLYTSWLWHWPYIGLWVLYLPLVALALCVVSYLSYVLGRSNTKGETWRTRALAIRRIWPVLVPIVVALGILFILFFHDSVQCWVHAPSYVVTHVQQTWHCTMGNRSL